MTPAPVTDDMVLMFGEPGATAVKRTFTAPDDLENCDPCEAVVHRSSQDPRVSVVRVPMALEPGDLEKLQAGGTVWLTMWGGLSPFAVEVVEPEPVAVPEVFKVTTLRPDDVTIADVRRIFPPNAG